MDGLIAIKLLSHDCIRYKYNRIVSLEDLEQVKYIDTYS